MAELRYDFSVIGQKNIDRAFASIERRAVRHNMRMAREFGGARRGTTASPAAASRVADMETKRRLASEVAAERKAAREKVRLDKWRQNIRNSHWQQEERNRRRAEALESRASQRALRERRRASGAIFGQAGSSVRSTTRAVGTMVGGTLAIGGGFMASAAVGQQMRETAAASTLANQAGRPGIKGQLLKEAQSVRGFSGEEALGALGSFVDLTGDLETARKLMGELGQMALATGSDIGDVASAAGNFSNQLKHIEDPAKRAEAVMEAMRALGGQGMAGAVELKDLASGGAVIAAASQMIGGGDKVRNIKQAGVLAQAARASGGASSADEATRSTARFMDFAAKNATDLERDLGIKVANRDETGAVKSLVSPKELIASYLQATGGDLSKVTKDFGEMGGRVVRGFMPAFEQGGTAGVFKEFDRLMQTELKQDEIDKRASSRLTDQDLQLKQVTKDFNAQVGNELLPVITRLIPEFSKLLPHVTTAARIFGKLVEELADNPLMTLGKIIAAKVALDIASAQIGNVIKEGIMDSVSGGGGSAGAAGSASGGGSRGLSIGNAVLNGVSIGTAAGLAIYATGTVNFEASEAQMERAGGRVLEAEQLLNAAKEGDRSALPRLRELLKEQQTDTDKATEKNIAAKGMFSGLDPILQGIMGAGKLLRGDIGGGASDLKGAFSGDIAGEGAATKTAETLGLINETNQRTNESFEKSIASFTAAAEKLAAGADKLSGAGDKLSQSQGGGGPSRPAAPSI